MKFILNYARLALVSFALVVFPVVGCAGPPRTPEQQQRFDETQQDLAETENALVVLAQQLEGMTPGTPEHTAVSQQIVDAAQRGAMLEKDLIDQDTQTAQGFLGGILDIVGMVVPGTEAFEPGLLALAPLAFKRPRQHFLNALQQVNPLNGQMAPAEAARSILAAAGLIHSSKNSAKVAEADMAHPKGVRAAASSDAA